MVNLHVGGNNLPSGSRDVTDTTPIADGVWHHVAVVIHLGQTVNFYIDGSPSSTQALASKAAANNAFLYLGSLPGSYNGGPFIGNLDEVRIYSAALQAGDISALAGAAGLPPVTVTVTPSSVVVAAGQTQQFTASVTGTTNTAVNWSVSPNVGTISATGLYTPPASLDQGAVVTVTAVSQADPTRSGFAVAAVTPSVQLPPAAGYWTFDTIDIIGNQIRERTNNAIPGTIPNTLPGTIVNATPLAAGRVNQAMSFSGAGSYVWIPDDPLIELNHDLTIATWVQTTNNSQTQDFISKYDFSGSEYGYMLQMLPNGTVNLHLGGNNVVSGSRDLHDNTVINDGQWHHVAVVIQLGQAVTFYIDGVETSTQAAATTNSGNTALLYLGTLPNSYNGLPYVGALDEVWIFPSALDAAQIGILAGGGS